LNIKKSFFNHWYWMGVLPILTFSLLLTACISPPTQVPTPTEPPTSVAIDTPTPTSAAQPTELPTTPTPPAIAQLKAMVETNLPLTPTPDASGFSPGGISEVRVLPLTVSDASRPLWAVFSFGSRNFWAEQNHFVAIYTQDDAGWQELARLELAPNFDSDPIDPGADYLSEESVTQVFVEPSRIWLQVEGGIGAHGGTYHLLSFDGEALQAEVAHSNPSPGAGGLADLNDDGTLEVMLNAMNPYVFCYACSVRKVAFQVVTWDSPNQRMFELSIQPMLMGQQGHPARKPTNRAVELAEAGLWKDALAKITEAKEVAAQATEPTDTSTLEWDYVLIKLHADAMAEEVAHSQYPLLSNIFYGDYVAVLDLMRPYSPGQIVGSDSPLVVGTVAEGWEETLSDWIIGSTNLALEAQPELAAAYFLRGWATYLVKPGSPEGLADIERAAELAPDEPLFTQVELTPPRPTRIQFDPGATSAFVEGEIAAHGVDDYVLQAMAGQRMIVSIMSPHNDVYFTIYGVDDGIPLVRAASDAVSWTGVLPATQDYIIKAVAAGESTPYTLEVIIPVRIEFDPGSTSAVIEGSIQAGHIDEYVLQAMAGQTMTVTITSPHNDVLLEIYGLDDGIPLVRSVSGATSWRGELRATQDYDIKAVSVGEDTNYTLEVIVE